MTAPEPLWTQYRQSYLQDSLQKVREQFLTKYSYDTSELSVEVYSLEISCWRPGDYRQEIKIKKGNDVLVLLELADLDDRKSDSDFLEFLGKIGDNYMPIGTALKLNRLELGASLTDLEIVALTRLITFFLMSMAELIVAEEALMNSQPPLLLEHWKRAYMFYPEKLIEFEGIRYLRSDAPYSNHH